MAPPSGLPRTSALARIPVVPIVPVVLLALLVASALSACGRDAPGGGAEGPGPDASGIEAVLHGSQSEADRALVELKGAARALVAADRAAIANRLGYEQAVTRHLREMEATGFRRRLPPGAPTADALRPALEAHAAAHGLTLVEVTVSPSEPGDPVPAEHRGEGPYPYAVDQLFTRSAVAIKLRPLDDARLDAFYRTLPSGAGPMLDIAGLREEGDEATLTGYAYGVRAVTPPVHVVRAPTLEELAIQAAVKAPAGHPRLAEVQALLDEDASLQTDLAGSMAVLGRAHLLGTQFRFFTERVGAIEARPLPKPIVTPGDKRRTP